MTTLNHRNRRAVNNHSIYQTDLHTSTNSLLNAIKNNTDTLEVNTDGLETLQTTANTHLETSATKLTNLQTINDTKLSAIMNFLDKDHAQFHLKHHPDDHHVMLAGNTAADGSGTKNHAHVDGSGILKVSQVSSQNIQPANTANADHASHSQSVAVGLRARTIITDESTGKFLHSTSAGELDIISTTKTLDTTHAGAFITINAGAVDGEITLGDRDNYVRYMIQKASSGFFDIHIEGSNDNSNFIPLQEITSAGAGSDFYGTALIHNPPKYLRLKNNHSGAQAIKIQIVSGRN